MSRFKSFASILLFAFLCGCVSSPIEAPIPTLTPTSTTTLALTATPTFTPMPSPILLPAEFLAQLNLQPDRTYIFEGGYYVDTYNGAKLAYLENGEWRLTTAEEKYGHLAPADMVEQYGGAFFDIFPGDAVYTDRGIRTTMFWAHWTGDYFERQVDNNGTEITEVGGIFVARDTQGTLYQLKIRLYSPDVPGVFEIFVVTQIRSEEDRDTEYRFGRPEDFLTIGSRVRIPFYSKLPPGIVDPHFCDEFGACTDQFNAARYSYWGQEGLQEYMDLVTEARDVSDPGDLVLIPSWQMTIWPPGR
jgi:hypothetical protein